MTREIRDRNGMTEEEFLAAYDPSKWDRPSVTVDMICYCRKNRSLLMVKRGGHPFIGKWALPGGFLEPTETAEQAAKRELIEETGVSAAELLQLRTFSDPERDPRTRIVTIAYLAVTDELPDANAGDDADDAKWFGLTYAPTSDGGIITLDGKETLEISFAAKYPESAIPVDPEVTVKASERIAGDHGKIISYAVIKLKELGIIT